MLHIRHLSLVSRIWYLLTSNGPINRRQGKAHIPGNHLQTFF